jgi:hypothetical protein
VSLPGLDNGWTAMFQPNFPHETPHYRAEPPERTVGKLTFLPL